MIKLFELNGQKVEIGPEVRSIREFAQVIIKDKGSPGDSQGRKKLRAMQELGYVFWTTDYRSTYKTYSQSVREDKIKKALGLPDSWKPDKAVKAAQKAYGELQKSVSLRSLEEIREALVTATSVITLLRRRIEESLAQEAIGDSVVAVKELIVLSEKLPSMITAITNLEEKVKLEQSVTEKIKGGGDIGDYEEP